MIVVKSKDEIEKMRIANRIVAEILSEIVEEIRPGITTLDIDKVAEGKLSKRNAKSAFKGYNNYPSSICTSVNEEVVHGIPSKRVLNEGDIISLDFGAYYNGYFGDAAVTVGVGKISETAQKLINIANEALYKGIEKAIAGNKLSDISSAIQKFVEGNGFSVVREFVGHGIGSSLHESPQVPNFGSPGKGVRLEPGMVLAIEPMINAGGSEVEILSDGWTAVTKDRSLSAHFEHSVAITKNAPMILSKI